MGNKKREDKLCARCFLLLSIFWIAISANSIKAEAATSAQEEAIADELTQMLQNMDTSTHYIYSYRVTTAELNEIYTNLTKTDTNLLIESYDYNLYLSAKTLGRYVYSVQFYNMNEDALTIYPKLVNTYNEIMSGVEESMSDLDKIIYFHDAIVEQVTYRKDGTNHVYGSNGALANGTAVCMGYADALMLFLNECGIEAVYVKEKTTLNHGWVYAKLDGEWYHIDPTWDDTRSTVKGEISRSFLLRNDEEFADGGKNSHGDYTWIINDSDEKSTSARFTNWYVHDVVGDMCFEDGYWYYVDTATNSIVRNTAEGDEEQLVLDGRQLGIVRIVDANENGVLYEIANERYLVPYDMAGKSTENRNDLQSIIETYSASFYLLKSGCSRPDGNTPQPGTNYISVGTGTIYEQKDVSDDDAAVAALIAEAPDVTNYLSEGEKVVWYVIKNTNSGWHVDGEIVKIDVEDASEVVGTEESAETERVTYNASFYLLKSGCSRPDGNTPQPGTNYISVGTGTIYEQKNVSNDDATVAALIAEAPDVTNYLSEGESVVWYVIKNTGSVWHVDGEIVKIDGVETSDESGIEESTKLEESTATERVTYNASFYLLKSGCSRPDGNTPQPGSNYMSVGTGTIYEQKDISDDDVAVAAMIAEAPDVTEYLSEGERVVWYVIKNTGSVWHVDGEIVKIDDVETSEVSGVEESIEAEEGIGQEENTGTEHVTYNASFYLLKSGCSRPDGNTPQPGSNYMSVGTGTIYEQKDVSDDDAAVAALIAETPDVTNYLSEGESVVWYVIKNTNSGWHVDGEIVVE